MNDEYTNPNIPSDDGIVTGRGSMDKPSDHFSFPDTLNTKNQIQQLRVTATPTPISTLRVPRTLNNAPSVPKPVSGIHTTLAQIPGTDNVKVNVHFARDPADKAYQSANVYLRQGSGNSSLIGSTSGTQTSFVTSKSAAASVVTVQSVGGSATLPMEHSPARAINVNFGGKSAAPYVPIASAGATGGGGGGGGGLSSVGLAMPGIFTVSGSPLTSNGTITVALATETANYIFAGPTSGSAAAPTFRAMVAADLPTSGVTAGSYTSTNLTVDAHGRITAASNGSSGGVTSIGIAVPSRQSVSGSPVTSSGTITISDNNQNANLVFAGPSSGSASAPTFRSLVTADLPADNTTRPIGITVDGGGQPPTTGIKGYLTIPFGCTITSWTIIADQSGSASFDVWFIAGSGAPPTSPNIPTSTNKISASAPIAISSAQSAAGGSSAISTWSPSLSQWGTLAFNLSSVSTVTRISVQIQVQLA